MKYDKFESLRQDRLKKLSAERARISTEDVKKTWASSPSKSSSVNQVLDSLQSSDMIEREKKRLEVVQRRQQKELEQLLNYEKRRQELKEQAETKMKEQERRMLAQKAIREKRETEWQIGMRE